MVEKRCLGMKLWRRAVAMSAVLSLVMLQGCATGVWQTSRGYSPSSFGQDVLSKHAALDGYQRRMRATVDVGLSRTNYMVGLDIRPGGGGTGYFVKVSDRRILQYETFAIVPAELAKLDRLIADSDIPKYKFGSWPIDDLCVDGSWLILEIADKTGYHRGTGNMECGVDYDGRAILRQMLAMAGNNRKVRLEDTLYAPQADYDKVNEEPLDDVDDDSADNESVGNE